MTNSLPLDLACAVILVLCAILVWIAHLASEARAERDAQKRKVEALEAQKAQLTLSQVQVSTAPTDNALAQILNKAEF
ncbi:hypothetical protein Gbth_017_162 [Gluconobacter thailandicus F149-1 = NBRC 100600]|uniref:Uncharacterized protein n=1 Tax=Gluconobacter thailandicus NBRC 3257 TaxID=1381097 RepID=A0ABQ0IW68_GLUTH|nr:hypothetical protein [Gluconobacter thailandicus]KXV54159.1 hypothetical protein AD946_04295 [Gluconobacter thailandicus]GAD26450.1 hypothetical protein NBRC3257_1449 [Gluconobacter thailandicus NBRC 3257]GAN92987.1 hypothetical protein Gbth_017_162 [Gluconobacter thailandicus F149-1 = NBRC 100600]GBR61599.1 hypothetical protein AA100600_2937 [Gluconobacter thailandicus F149-1 = NBRC 100600]GEL87464.1 hypothetical protein GTH01_18220 [Gluconobacter thailandicus F149-1 = NBRC 100600]